MGLDITIEDNRWKKPALAELAAPAAAATLRRLQLSAQSSEISLLGCDDARISALNADFRGKAQPTNVLSWPSQDLSADTPGDTPRPPAQPALGDIAIAYETCAREAEAQGKDFADHVTHLLVHGILHLLGYDHIHTRDAALMEGLEVEILAILQVADPY